MQTTSKRVFDHEEMKNDLLTSTFERIRSRLFLKARTVLADDEDARDILQDAFFRLWQVRHDIESESSATGLLVTTVKNLSIDRLRRKATHPTAPLNDNIDYPDSDPADETEKRQEILSDVQQIINRHLSRRDQEILLHRDRDEWSFEDLAKHYDISEANARLIVARARKTIRNIYTSRQ